MTYLDEQPVTNADKVFIELRNSIVEGEVKAGSKLSETELSTRFSVSRAVIREAINRLNACRLIQHQANKGARVIQLTTEGLLELYQIREALEGKAAYLAAQQMSDEEINALQDLLTEHSKTIKGEQSYYQKAGPVDFHYRIILGSNNKHLISMLLNDIYHLVRMYRVQLGMIGPRISSAFDEHQHIVKAIRDRDADLAEILMRRHINYSLNAIKQKLPS